MQFPEEDSPALKEWIVKRLENTSDADADVLADYVLALLHNANDDTNVQEVFDAEITPFLKEDTKIFTNDLIQTIKHRSYVPGAPPPPQAQTIPTSQPSFGGPFPNQPYLPTGPAVPGRKRGFQDRGDFDAPDGREQYLGGARPFKQPRRVGGRRGYVDPDRPQPVQEMQYGYPNAPGLNANAPAFAPGGPALDMTGFVPNGDPMEAMRKLQELQQQINLQMARFPNFLQQQSYPSQRQQPQRRRGRCRDYDNKGYCARGHNCMYEHSNESGATFNNLPAPQVSGQIQLPSGENEPNPAQLMNFPVAQPGFPDPAMPPVDIYNSNSNNSNSNSNSNASPSQRRNTQHGQQHQKRSGPKRAPFSFLGPMHDRTQTKLVVECIPEENFDEKQIRDFFSQFGKIEEVTMMAYKRLAIVKFDTWYSASAAYNSPSVIFNNRFVKLFWYKEEKHAELGNGGTNGVKKEPSATNGSRASADIQEPEIDMDEFKKQQDAAQKAHEEKMRIKKELAEKRAELDKKRKELQAKQEAEKQKLAKLAAIKKESEAPGAEDTIEKDESAKPSKTSSQTETLRATLAKLQEEAKSIGLDPHVNGEEDATISTYSEYSPHSPYSNYTPRGGRGGYFRGGRGGYVPRGAYRGRGGASGRGNIHAAYAAFSLDNRPKKVALTGVDFSAPDKDEALRQHLFSLGELSAEIQITPAKTHVGFSDRKAAENFFNSISGALPSDKVEVAWVANTAGPLPGSATSKIEATGSAARNGGAAGEEEGFDSVMADSDGKQNGGQSQLDGVEEDYDVAGDNEWDIA